MTTAWQGMRWQLGAAQWDVLTEFLGLDGYPAPIRVRVHGRTHDARARIKAQVIDELSGLGLLRGGRVDPELRDAVELLHRPACWVDSVWLPDADAEEPVRVVAARLGEAGVCAVQRPEEPGAIVLDVIPTTGLAAAVIGKLPAHPPGTSRGVTVAIGAKTGTTTRAEDGSGLLVSASAARTDTERDTAAAAAILERKHSRAGQIAANLRDPNGRVRRSEVLRWCDNPDGRYQVTLLGPPGEQDRLRVAPADPRRLGEAVQRLLESLHTS